MITLIVAYDENRLIGNGLEIPWKISEDFKHFKKTTTGNIVIMGRKTWDSLPKNYKPLPDRTNMVVSSKAVMLENEWHRDDLYFEDSLSDAIEFAKGWINKEIFIIGGAQIYEQSLPFADRILASEVKGKYVGDVYFPEFEYKTRRVVEDFNDFSIVEYGLSYGLGAVSSKHG